MQNVMIWAFVIFIWVSSTVMFIVMIILCIVFVYILCTVYIVAVLVFGFVCVGVCGQRLALRSSAPALDCGWLPRRTWRWSAHSLLHLKYAASQRFSSSCCLGFDSILLFSTCFHVFWISHSGSSALPAPSHSSLSPLRTALISSAAVTAAPPISPALLPHLPSSSPIPPLDFAVFQYQIYSNSNYYSS